VGVNQNHRESSISAPNYAPWGSPARMRVLAAISIVGGLSLAIVGVLLLLQSGPGTHHRTAGWLLLALGVVGVLFVSAAIPTVRRRGQM
jgi:hypothetical protein